MRTLVFTNDKGGVSKTTSVVNLGVGLAREGLKTLVIDLDSQGDATYTLLGTRPPLFSEAQMYHKTAYTMMIEQHPLLEVALEAPRYPNLWVVPSNDDLAKAGSDLSNEVGSQTQLDHILHALPKDTYDYVLIDTGKGFDLLVINALAAADEALILTTPGKFELDAVARMKTRVEKVRERINTGKEYPQLRGIVLTNANHYTVARDTRERLEEQYPGLIFQTVIPKNEDLSKAVARAQSIFEFNPSSKGGQAYEALLKEVIAHGR